MVSKRHTTYFFVGTIAELIKFFPVIKEFGQRGASIQVIASGQNDVLKSELWPLTGHHGPDLILSHGPRKQNAHSLIFWFLKTLILSLFRLPGHTHKNGHGDWMVHGDTVSTVMGALLGRALRMRVVHLEAGLRSFNYLHPFPEEIDRVIVSHLAHVHLCPNEWSMKNLKGKRGIVFNTGENTLIDSLAIAKSLAISATIPFGPSTETRSRKRPKIANQKSYFVAVLHRQENLFDETLVRTWVDEICRLSEKIPCILLMHKLTEIAFARLGQIEKLKAEAGITMVPRQPYVEFMKLLSGAQFLITDGGSNQEEAYYMGLPCLILRNATERNEGLNHNVVLAGRDPTKISAFARNHKDYRREPIITAISPSKTITDFLLGQK